MRYRLLRWPSRISGDLLYVADDSSPATADRLIDAVVDRFDLLVEQPAMGRSRPEFGMGVRSFVVESYVTYSTATTARF